MLTAPDDRISAPLHPPAHLPTEVDERAARRTLRAQIARLERELGQVVASNFPYRVGYEPVPHARGPRLLSLGELETIRDALADRVGRATEGAAELAESHSLNRELLERMRRDPRRYKFVRIARVDVGGRGCGHYHVRPRLGVIGMLAGWWHVKLSSGCPLAGGRRAERRPVLMGKRSRKRASTQTAGAETVRNSVEAERPVAAPPRPPASPRRRARLSEAPKAPWAPFPLVELCILVAFVLIVAGFLTSGSRRPLLLACGFALVTLSSLELSIREHFSGYRSHSTLLAGVAAIAANVPLYFLTELPQEVLLAFGIGVFAIAFWLLRGAFQRRAGGLGFRV